MGAGRLERARLVISGKAGFKQRPERKLLADKKTGSGHLGPTLRRKSRISPGLDREVGHASARFRNFVTRPVRNGLADLPPSQRPSKVDLTCPQGTGRKPENPLCRNLSKNPQNAKLYPHFYKLRTRIELSGTMRMMHSCTICKIWRCIIATLQRLGTHRRQNALSMT